MSQLIWSGHELPAVRQSLYPQVLQLNLLNRDFELYHYRGFSCIIAEDRIDHDYSVMAKKLLAQTPDEFVAYRSPDGGLGTELLDASLDSREKALARFTTFVDDYHKSH